MKSQSNSTRTGLDLEAAFSRAVALEKQGNPSEADKIYRTILKQHPNHFRTLHNLGIGLIEAGRFEEAVRYLRKALNQEPNSAEANAKLANALWNLERPDEALERAKRAVALNDKSPDAHAVLAEALATLGRYDEARHAQGRAIDLAPDRPDLYYYLGQIMRWHADDPRLATLEALAQKSRPLSLSEQIAVNFALAKAYSDCGDVERAFRHQVEGGALKRRTIGYDEAWALRRMNELCHSFDAEWLGRHQGIGDPSSLPVFILGMPRSGTTLVEQILASHPKVGALGERRFFEDALDRVSGMPQILRSPAGSAVGWPDSELRRVGAFYVEAARRVAPPAVPRSTDKAPLNFQFVGLIHAVLPKARIIHTRREPINTCLSIFSILFTGVQFPFSYDLGELGRYYRAYEKMMAHWRNVLPAGIMLEVQYEDVVDDLEGQARRIVAHCGLEWDDACLGFYKNDRPVRTASHAQVRQPIYRSSVMRPRPPRELLLPLLEALGTG